MSQSEQVNELAAALAKAQGEMEAAKYNRINPHFKSRYADMASVIEASKVLSKHGLSITQLSEPRVNGDYVLRTTLLHSSGQWLSSEYPLPTGLKPQELGSHRTYLRRYEWSSIIGIAADDDDDANVAQKAEPRKNPHVTTPTDIIGEPIEYNALGEPVDNIPLGDPSIERLRVKDARPEYALLSSEIRKIKSLPVLEEWGKQNANRVASLSNNWQEILRGEYREKMIELGWKPKEAKEVKEANDAGEPRELAVGDSWEYFGSLMIELAKQPNWKEWDEANRVNTRRMQNEDPKNFALMEAGIKESRAKNVHLRSRN